MRYLLLVVVISFSYFARADSVKWEIINSGGGSIHYSYETCGYFLEDKLITAIDSYPNHSGHSLVSTSCTDPIQPEGRNGGIHGYAKYTIYAIPSGNECSPPLQAPAYPDTACSLPPEPEPDPTPEPEPDPTPEPEPDPTPEPEPDPTPDPEPDLCDATPKPAFCIDSDADGGGSDGSDTDADGGGSGGGGDSGGGSGGGDGSGIDDGGSGGDDGGSGGDDGADSGDGIDDFCKTNPDMCPPVDKPECVDKPWLCDVENPERDLIAAIDQVTKKLNDQHRTQIENKANTFNTASNTFNTASNTSKQLDKTETIKNNTKVIADNTNKATDHLKAIDDRVRNSNTLLAKNARGLDSRLSEVKDAINNKGIPDPDGGGSAGGDGDKLLKEIRDELRKGFCDNNKDHPSCITEISGDAYKGVFDSSDLADVKAKTDDIKARITNKIDTFKSLLGTPNIAHGGKITPIEFSLSHQGHRVSVKQDGFNQVGDMSKAIVIALCSVLALMIVVRT